MIPIQHPTTNCVLHGGENTVPLPATRVVYEHPFDSQQSMSGFKTYWRPTMEEIYAISEGACITLEVLSESHPPVKIGVE